MLEVEQLCFSVRDLDILNEASLSVKAGETVGVIGPNGSGKTTLFNCISGFCLPDSGRITFKEKDITRLPASARAALGLGRVFQNFGIFREMTVLENIVTAIEGRQSWHKTFFPWSKQHKANCEAALEYLDEVNLADRAGAKAGSLSGGQMRLLEVIRTLAFGADLFLLDEPTAGVSPRMKEDVAALICKLQEL